jgi:hypothetical protein
MSLLISLVSTIPYIKTSIKKKKFFLLMKIQCIFLLESINELWYYKYWSNHKCNSELLFSNFQTRIEILNNFVTIEVKKTNFYSLKKHHFQSIIGHFQFLFLFLIIQVCFLLLLIIHKKYLLHSNFPLIN